MGRAGYAGVAGATTQPTFTGVIDRISFDIEPWDTAKGKPNSKNATWTQGLT